MFNAEELFRHCQSTWSWLRLQSLALTLQLLQDDLGKRRRIEALLCRASVLVQKMPKLHTFVLWNGGKAHACAILYCIDRDGASITLAWNVASRVERSRGQVMATYCLEAASFRTSDKAGECSRSHQVSWRCNLSARIPLPSC